jgi:hypothetical protein
MMGWRGSLSRKRRQGTSVRRHVEINCRINPLTSIDKLAETSWRIIKSIDRDEEEKIRGEWSRIHS